MMTKSEKKQWLINFEKDIEEEFLAACIRAPIHLSDGNEEQLINLFSDWIEPHDLIFSTWRSHYHALLHGLDPIWLKTEIMKGKSMSINHEEPFFFSSAIVGSTPSIAAGAAWAIKNAGVDKVVWCFVGDMGAQTGAFHEAYKWSFNLDLPIFFVIEDNYVSVGSPTHSAWGREEVHRLDTHVVHEDVKLFRYSYVKNKYPHVGAGKWVTF